MLAVNIDPNLRDLVADALDQAAEHRKSGATLAAGELADEHAAGAVKDERPGAVKIARFLADAAKLSAAAAAIRTAEALDVDALVAELVADMPAPVVRGTFAPRDTIVAVLSGPEAGIELPVVLAELIADVMLAGAFNAETPDDRPAASPRPAPSPSAAAPAPSAPSAPAAAPLAPGQKVAGAERRDRATAMADTHAVLAKLGMTFTPDDVAGGSELDDDDPFAALDNFDDGALPEDGPSGEELAAIAANFPSTGGTAAEATE